MSLLRPEEYEAKLAVVLESLERLSALEEKARSKVPNLLDDFKERLEELRVNYQGVYDMVKMPEARILYTRNPETLPKELQGFLANQAVFLERQELVINLFIGQLSSRGKLSSDGRDFYIRNPEMFYHDFLKKIDKTFEMEGRG